MCMRVCALCCMGGYVTACAWVRACMYAYTVHIATCNHITVPYLDKFI